MRTPSGPVRQIKRGMWANGKHEIIVGARVGSKVLSAIGHGKRERGGRGS